MSAEIAKRSAMLLPQFIKEISVKPLQLQHPILSDADAVLHHKPCQFVTVNKAQPLVTALGVFESCPCIAACGYKYPLGDAVRVHCPCKLADFIRTYGRIGAVSFCLQIDHIQAQYVFGDDAVYGSVA